MPRLMKAAAAQLGPIARSESRRSVVDRMIELLRQAKAEGVRLVVFPEMALTTFFPRWYIEDQREIDAYFETEMPGPETRRLFEAASEAGIGFYLGYCEKIEEAGATHRYNSSILVERDGRVVARYRKVHLPGHEEPEDWRPFQHLERKYFEPGPETFRVEDAFGGRIGLAICNDRRWPETFRVMGMQGVELVMLGYNTPVWNGFNPTRETPQLRMFHNHLSMQAGAYQNGTYVIGSAKAGLEEGVEMQGGSCVVAPTGEIVALAETVYDELVAAELDFDACQFNKNTVFNFAKHRRIEHYGLITARAEAVPPPEA